MFADWWCRELTVKIGIVITCCTLAVAWPSRADAPAGHYEISDTVLDRGTGLRWQRLAAPGVYDWDHAFRYCNDLGGGWRLPAVKELLTIVDPTLAEPAIDPKAFPKMPAELHFWAVSFFNNTVGVGWQVSFSDGSAQSHPATDEVSVRCVR